jgi:hypothetical protein
MEFDKIGSERSLDAAENRIRKKKPRKLVDHREHLELRLVQIMDVLIDIRDEMRRNKP